MLVKFLRKEGKLGSSHQHYQTLPDTQLTKQTGALQQKVSGATTEEKLFHKQR